MLEVEHIPVQPELAGSGGHPARARLFVPVGPRFTNGGHAPRLPQGPQIPLHDRSSPGCFRAEGLHKPYGYYPCIVEVSIASPRRRDSVARITATMPCAHIEAVSYSPFSAP